MIYWDLLILGLNNLRSPILRTMHLGFSKICSLGRDRVPLHHGTILHGVSGIHLLKSCIDGKSWVGSHNFSMFLNITTSDPYKISPTNGMCCIS